MHQCTNFQANHTFKHTKIIDGIEAWKALFMIPNYMSGAKISNVKCSRIFERNHLPPHCQYHAKYPIFGLPCLGPTNTLCGPMVSNGTQNV